MKKAGEHIRVNFGQEPFAFEIDKLVKVRSHELSFSPSRGLSWAELTLVRKQNEQAKIKAAISKTR